MSYQSPSELGPEAGRWLHEPCRAAEAQAGTASWRDKDLDLELFASGHSPHETSRKDPSTPMAEDIRIASRRQQSSHFVGRSIDATTTRQSHSEVQATKNGTNQLHASQYKPASAAPIDINLPAGFEPSKLSPKYFPCTLSTQAVISPRMGPFKLSPEPRDVEAPSDDYLEKERRSIESESRRDDMEDQSAAWKEVRDLRDEILGLRSLVHQKRVSLKEMGRTKAEADNLLFSRMMMVGKGVNLEAHSLPGLGQKGLQQLMDECQEARNNYGPEEDDCIALEDKLSRLEFKLNRLEQPFFLRVDEPHPSPPPAEKTSTLAAPDDDSGSESSFDDEFEEPLYHPLVTRFLSKLGDLDLLQERRDNLSDEKRSLEGEKASRARFGMVLSPEDQSWLDGSQAEYDNLVKEIDLLEKELVDLKRDCLDRGLVDEDGEPTNFQDLEEASFNDEEELNPKDQTSEYVKYPKLLPLHRGRKHEDVDFYEPEPDETSDIPTTRINKWILGSLRISPLDVNFLARTFEGRGGKTSTQWEIAVLNFWYRDDTIKNNTEPLRAHASSLITETDISNPNKLKHPGDDSPFSSFFSSIRGLTSISDQATELLFAAGDLPTSPKRNV